MDVAETEQKTTARLSEQRNQDVKRMSPLMASYSAKGTYENPVEWIFVLGGSSFFKNG